MVRHEAACRRWRACVAMHNMSMSTQRGSCAHKLGDYPEGHWQNLSNFISGLESSDMVLKTETLHHLALFLLYVAPTSESTFTCPDAQTISLHFQNRNIILALKDIQTLYRLIFFNLANCIAWLFKWETAGKKSGETLSDRTCGSHCDHASLEFTVKLLQCCIYILPLLEFNTGLSLVAADTLNSLYKQLVSPANHFSLHFKQFDEVVDNHRTLHLNCPHNYDRLQAFCCVQCAGVHSNTPMILVASVEASIKDLIKDLLSLQNGDLSCSNLLNKKETTCALLHDQKVHCDRSQIALALLEVFLEELLLQPHLADILKASDILQSQFSPEKQVAQAVEAAAIHFIFSVLGAAHTKELQQDVEHESLNHHGFRLTLPAAVMLLDLSLADDMHAPDMFLVHIINMLRCSLKRSSCSVAELPGEIALGFVASALESATSLFLKCWKANALPLHHSLLQHGELLKCLSNKLLAICDGDAKKAASLLDLLLDQENNSKALQQENDPTRSALFCECGTNVISVGNETHRCYLCATYQSTYNQRQEQLMTMDNKCFSVSRNFFSKTKTTLLVSVLQLISTALFCLTAETAKTIQTTLTPNVTEQHASNGEVYIRHIRKVFKFCASVDRTKVLGNFTLDTELRDVILVVDELAGNTFTFFTEQLLLCVKQGAPKALRQAYLEVLTSLLTLSPILQRGISKSAFDFELLCQAELRPSDGILTNVEDQHVHSQPFSNDCKLHNEAQPHIDECKQYTADFVSSTLLMTKIYQRKRKSLVKTDRKNETIVAATENEPVDGAQCLPEEENLKTNEMITPKYRSCGNGDAYIKEVIACEGEVDGECFGDLSDFIVCKEGRNYSRWMKVRYKKRKKKMRKTVWQRMKAKKELVTLLTSGKKDHL